MKRKWFTLLFAFLAVASFRAFAGDPPIVTPACNPSGWWITLDTTGLKGSTSTWQGNDFPFSGGKTICPNWFIYDQNATKVTGQRPDYDPRYDGPKALYDVKQVGANNKILTITPKSDANGSLQLSYGGKPWTTFEVVRFLDATGSGANGNLGIGNTAGGWTPGVNLRTTMQLFNDGIGSAVNSNRDGGYLMPTEGGSAALTDTTSSMLFVVSDLKGNLSIQRWDDIFTEVLAPSTPAVPAVPPLPLYNGAIFFGTSWPSWNSNTTDAAIMTARFNAINALLPAGQKQMTATGSYLGGFDRNVSFATAAATTAVTGVNVDFSNPAYTTQYKGGLLSNFPADLLTNPAYWTNGLPYFGDINPGVPSDGLGLSGVKNPLTGNDVQFYIVVQKYTTPATSPDMSAPVPAIPAGPLVGTGTYNYKVNPLKDANGNIIKDDNGNVLIPDLMYRPIWIKLEKPAGHWATPADFPGAYTTFAGLDVGVADTKYGNAPIGSTTYNTFAVTFVDQVSRATTSGNMIGNSGTTYGYPYKGQQAIDLFTLSSPQNGCKVVSVSRQNDLDIQSQGNGVYANKLELRTYGTYMYYKQYKKGSIDGTYPKADSVAYIPVAAKSTNFWDAPGTGQPAPGWNELTVATSLQKFAIWIDECGRMTLYPAASYAWKYGNDKNGNPTDLSVGIQPNNVLPNSVLIYDDVTIEGALGSTSSDTDWGTKIGYWNGKTTANGGTEHWQLTTVPNNFQQRPDYAVLSFDPQAYNPDAKNLEGKYFYLQVDANSVGIDAAKGLDGATAGKYDKGAFAPNAIQDYTKTEYVLSTEVVWDANRNGWTKSLIMIPKEKVRRYDNSTGNLWYQKLLQFKAIENLDKDGNVPSAALLQNYWSQNPYDMVNMASHWSVVAVKDNDGNITGYNLVNMLGDVLQYNNGSPYIAGGNVVENSLISTIYSGNLGANIEPATGATNSKWSVSQIPGQEGSFVMGLAGSSLQLGAWKSTANSVFPVYARTDSAYWKRNVTLVQDADPTVASTFSCPSSLLLTEAPIYYVPNYSGSFADENQKLGDTMETINTSDVTFKDGNGSMDRDALTAYLYLNGTYGIKEAVIIGNDLLLGSEEVEWNKTIAAAFTAGAGKDLVFTPLERTDRAAHIAACGYGYTYSTDYVGGDMYKWFVVQNAAGQYLVYDSIAPAATTDIPKTGFTFQTTDVANATPIRLYQPLVGDKLQGNFIIEFNIPRVTYTYTATNKGYTWNNWPGNIYTIINNNGGRAFGKLGDQSNYINAVADYKNATRLTYTFIKGAPTCCPEQYIEPKWMADNRLLNLPVNGQLWDLKEGALGMGFSTSKNEDGKNVSVNEAIASNGISKLTFIYVDSIRSKAWGNHGAGYVYYTAADNKSNQSLAVFYNNRYVDQVDVPLYNIRNSDGLYLTVDTTTYQDATGTGKDVSGVNLVWAKPIARAAKDSDPYKDLSALQLFAISGSQTDTLAGGWYTACMSYVYLPLASYQVDYKTGKVDKSVIVYNTGLGKKGTSSCYTTAPVNDITQAFRVGQYSKVNRNQKNLIVLNANGADRASYIPVAMKWQRQKFLKPDCSYILAQKVNSAGVAGDYYTFNGMTDKADANTLKAHWQISVDPKIDPDLINFTPELKEMYGVPVDTKDKVLKDKYYLIDTFKNANTYIALAGYDKLSFKPVTDTIRISCVCHTLPFFDLEKDGGYNINAVTLAILETPFLDRNITDAVAGEKPTPIYHGKNLIGYQVYLNQLDKTANFKDSKYLTVYKENVRDLTGIGEDECGGGHIIPYYSFSLTDKDGVESFLNVDSYTKVAGQDSVYWTKVSKDSVAKLLDYETYPNFMSRYKFCLPYKLNQDGSRAAEVAYGDGGMTYPPVYIQTLDTARLDVPFLVVAGAATKYVTARKLDDALLPTYRANDMVDNIYTVNYADIDSLKVTSWIFGGPTTAGQIWVPIADIIGRGNEGATKDGQLTDQKLGKGGVSFITESKMDPNYGTFTGIKDAPVLTLTFEGDTTIGSYATKEIWYYRISLDKDKYLTDATGDANVPTYRFNGVDYHLGYFDKPKDFDKNYIRKDSMGIFADTGFKQTFGFRYVTDSSDPNQAFYIVSNADYTAPKNVVETGYRYLAQVNNHLVFVGGTSNAMVFQWGKAADGSYTNLEVVGQGNIFGVKDGIRVTNTTGKVDVYSIDGRLIKSTVLTGSDQTIAAPRGIAIVKAGSEVVKVVVQ